MPCTAKHLNSAAKWRDNHREQVKTISREFLSKNREKETLRLKKFYQFKKESLRLMKILL